MAERETALALLDKTDGQLLDFEALAAKLGRAESPEVAALAADLAAVKEEIGAAEALVSDELVARLDRQAKWTQRLGDPKDGVQYEVKAPSPTAGTEAYDERLLEAALRELVAARTIDEKGAAPALDRVIVVALRVPLAADLDQLAATLKDAREIRLAGVRCEPAKVEPLRSPKLPGISALRKVPGTAEALDAAKRERPAGRRRASVKVIRAEG